MKKIGIITLFDLKNYGNRLQAYALSKIISKLNCNVLMIRYCGYGIMGLLRDFVKKNHLLFILSELCLGVLKREKLGLVIKKCKRADLFSSFSRNMNNKIILSHKKSIDYYVCGSDQIWNPNFAGHSSYFATFAPKEKRISYAASFGISKIPEKFVDSYKKNLTDMSYISVRENEGAEITKELTGRDVPVLIDPTLMLDADEWRKVSKKPRLDITSKYILTYFLGEVSETTNEYIENIAKENDLEVISLNKCKQNDFWNYTGPSEFIWLIENASLVCTDSFHASVFSVIMDTPFIVFRREEKGNDMNSRIKNLLEMLKLQDRFIDCVKEGEEFRKDYCHIPEILDVERNKSIKFLKEALDLS